jgi:hypothetical protein
LLCKGDRESFQDADKEDGRDLRLEKNHLARWDVQCEQIKFTPLHWLAYHNDHRSVKLILQIYLDERLSSQSKADPLSEDDQGQTFLDLAGRNDSKDVVRVTLDFFKRNFDALVR